MLKPCGFPIRLGTTGKEEVKAVEFPLLSVQLIEVISSCEFIVCNVYRGTMY